MNQHEDHQIHILKDLLFPAHDKKCNLRNDCSTIQTPIEAPDKYIPIPIGKTVDKISHIRIKNLVTALKE